MTTSTLVPREPGSTAVDDPVRIVSNRPAQICRLRCTCSLGESERRNVADFSDLIPIPRAHDARELREQSRETNSGGKGHLALCSSSLLG